MNDFQGARLKTGSPKKRLSGKERRRKIIKASMELFSRKGFTATTTKEIAQAAGISESLIYTHFKDKLALYEAIIEKKVKDAGPLFCSLDEAKMADEREMFRTVVSNFVRHHLKDLDFIRLSLFSALEGQEFTRAYVDGPVTSFFNFLGAYIKRHARRGALKEVEPRVAARCLVGMVIYFVLLKEIYKDRAIEDVDDSTLEETITDLFCKGILEV